MTSTFYYWSLIFLAVACATVGARMIYRAFMDRALPHLEPDQQARYGARSYEIWVELFPTEGTPQKVQFLGQARARTFKDACDIYFGRDRNYDKTRMTYGKCRLFQDYSGDGSAVGIPTRLRKKWWKK